MRFDSYHPMINFIFFAAVIALSIACDHPVFLLISYGASFAYSVKLKGIKALCFNLLLIPLMIVWTWWYSYYTHFGVTVLSANFAGNSITLESVVYGGVIGVTAASVIMWISCIFTVFTTDKVTYLFGKISPKLSLWFSILLRMIPQVKRQYRKLAQAQQGIGRGTHQGNPFQRVFSLFRILSAVIMWNIEHMVSTSDSMRSRGYTLKGRTAFSIYRFDNRDRSFVTAIFWLIAVVLMGALLNQTSILYNPEIILNRITPFSTVFFAAYLALCLLPMILQIITEKRFERLREKNF